MILLLSSINYKETLKNTWWCLVEEINGLCKHVIHNDSQGPVNEAYLCIRARGDKTAISICV